MKTTWTNSVDDGDFKYAIFSYENRIYSYEIRWAMNRKVHLNCLRTQKAYQLVRNFQLRAELIKITSFERAQKTEQEHQIFSKTYFQVSSKNFLKYIPQQK